MSYCDASDIVCDLVIPDKILFLWLNTNRDILQNVQKWTLIPVQLTFMVYISAVHTIPGD